MDTNNVVNEVPLTKEPVVTPEEVKVDSTSTSNVVYAGETPQKPGSKTDPALLLQALQEEREKRRIEEEKRRMLEKQLQETGIPRSDEGKYLEEKLNKEIEALKEQHALEKLEVTYPAIKDKASEFNDYRAQYPGVPLESVARLFLVDKDLIEKPTERKGLEKPTGGGRQTSSGEMTVEEIAELRANNGRKYTKLLLEGKIRIPD